MFGDESEKTDLGLGRVHAKAQPGQTLHHLSHVRLESGPVLRGVVVAKQEDAPVSLSLMINGGGAVAPRKKEVPDPSRTDWDLATWLCRYRKSKSGEWEPCPLQDRLPSQALLEAALQALEDELKTIMSQCIPTKLIRCDGRQARSSMVQRTHSPPHPEPPGGLRSLAEEADRWGPEICQSVQSQEKRSHQKSQQSS